MITTTMFGASSLLMQPTLGSASSQLLPFMIIALLIDATIVAIWYMIGAILNNSGMKSSARGEFLQFVTTAIIAAIILASLLFFGSIYVNSVNPTGTQTPSVLSSQQLSQICFNAAAQPLTYMKDQLYNPATNICGIVLAGPSGSADQQMNYPLAASGVILANMTNQVAIQMNSTFIVDAFASFLQKLSPTLGVCVQPPSDIGLGPCTSGVIGIPPVPFYPEPPILYVKFSNTPLAGLDMITKSLASFSNLLYLTLMAFVVQLEFTNIFIYVWPFLIFFGLVLRATPFTRKIGGALIAIALGATLFYPSVFGLEYLAANNNSIAPQPTLNFCDNGGGTLSLGGFVFPTFPYQYKLNFFVLPDVSRIAQQCGCWPYLGLLNSETMDVVAINNPIWWSSLGVSMTEGVGNFFLNLLQDIWNNNYSDVGNQLINAFFNIATLSQTPDQFAGALSTVAPVCPIGSPTSGGEGFVFSLMEAYGLTGVTAYFLPILNVLITLSAVIGLSRILGGDTEFAGISRFV